MKTLLLLVFIFFINSADAKIFYFSSSSGNDSRTTLEAQNPATPWKTLSKLNEFFSSLLPGDFVLLKRGDTFEGNIIASKSGTNTVKIVIGAYGTGAQPVVTGLVTLKWKSLGNNRYQSQELLLNSINLVTRNNFPLAMARWPNDDKPLSGYNIIQSHTWDTVSHTGSISSSSISAAPKFTTGAELVMRVKHFIIDRDHVTSYTKSKISFTADYAASLKYPPNDNYGYYLQNDSIFLDKQNEWWYSGKTRKVSIFSKNGAPTGVKATMMNNLVTVAGFGYVTFDNIKFEGANEVIFNLSGTAGNITVQNCTINGSGGDGIYSSSPYTVIKNNIISNCLSRSIFSGIRNAYIGYNKISNTGALIGMGESGDNQYIGIVLRGANSMVEYNRITKTGYSGLYLASGSNNTTIQYNRIDSFCLVKNDGAGIYCYSRRAVSSGRNILYNIISNGGVGKAVDGADKPYTPNNRAEAIYCDQETSGLTLKYNTLFNCYRGLFLNPGCHHIDAERNTTYNNYLYEFYINVGANVGPGKDPMMVGNIIKNNIYVAARPGTITGYFLSQGWNLTTAGLIDNNYYARPLDDNKTIFNNGPIVSLAAWKAAHPTLDMHSNKSPKSISKSSDLFLQYNETGSPKTIKLSSKCIDITGKGYSNSITLQPYTSIVLIKNGSGIEARGTEADTLGYNTGKSAAITTKMYDKISGHITPIPAVTNNVNREQANPDHKFLTTPVVDQPAHFSVSPNPAGNIIRVNFSKLGAQNKAMLKILDINGKMVKTYPVTLSGTTIEVEISALPAGMYLLNLSGDGINFSNKIIKAY